MALGAWPKPCKLTQTLTVRPWRHIQRLVAWSKPWVRGQGSGGVAKAVGAWLRPWGRGEDLGGVAKAVGA